MEEKTVKIRLKGRTSPEKPGTRVRHFGTWFVVQKDKTLVAEEPESIAQMQLDADRVDLVKDKPKKGKIKPAKVEEPEPEPELEVEEELEDEEEDETEDEEEVEDEYDDQEIDFSSMTKDELVAWATDNHGVDLDPKDSKKELIEQCKDLVE